MSLLNNRYTISSFGMKQYAGFHTKWISRPAKQSETSITVQYTGKNEAERTLKVAGASYKEQLFELLNNTDIWNSDGTAQFLIGAIAYKAELNLMENYFQVTRDYANIPPDQRLTINVPEETIVDFSFLESNGTVTLIPFDPYNPLNKTVFFVGKTKEEGNIFNEQFQLYFYPNENEAFFQIWKSFGESVHDLTLEPSSQVWVNNKCVTFKEHPGHCIEVWCDDKLRTTIPYSMQFMDHLPVLTNQPSTSCDILAYEENGTLILCRADKEKELIRSKQNKTMDNYIVFEEHGARRMKTKKGKPQKEESRFWSAEHKRAYQQEPHPLFSRHTL